MINNIKFDESGLIPTIIQDHTTGKVLMLAYMNDEALQKSIDTKETWFYSRSRNELWNKGATSGNKQTIKSIDLDCDQDALLITVEPWGPACHTGEFSCFFNSLTDTTTDISIKDVIQTIIETIEHRRHNPEENSYTNYLFSEGIDKVLKKVGEEASEVIIGAKNDNKDEIIWEIADLIYHTLVLMNITNISLSEIKTVLYERHIQKNK